MDMSIRFPHLGISLPHVGKTITIFGFDIAYYGIIIALAMIVGISIAMKAHGAESGHLPGHANDYHGNFCNRVESLLCYLFMGRL